MLNFAFCSSRFVAVDALLCADDIFCLCCRLTQSYMLFSASKSSRRFLSASRSACDLSTFILICNNTLLSNAAEKLDMPANGSKACNAACDLVLTLCPDTELYCPSALALSLCKNCNNSRERLLHGTGLGAKFSIAICSIVPCLIAQDQTARLHPAPGVWTSYASFSLSASLTFSSFYVSRLCLSFYLHRFHCRWHLCYDCGITLKKSRVRA